MPVSDAAGGASLRFEVDGTTLAVVDPVERCRALLDCDAPVEGACDGVPLVRNVGTGATTSDDRESSTDADDGERGGAPGGGPARLAESYPVDEVVAVRAAALSPRAPMLVVVREPATGDVLGRVSTGDAERFDGPAVVELTTTPKLYVHVPAPLAVRSTSEGTTIELRAGSTGKSPPPMAVGARSRHERPRRTVTTTDDPRDLMTAVSATATALKTTSPERSWPTLRGHPPRVEVGDRLDLDGADLPDAGIQIAVPPQPGAVLAVAPLAFYLPARVVPGDRAAVRTDGLEWPLPGAPDTGPDAGFDADPGSDVARTGEETGGGVGGGESADRAVGAAAARVLRHVFALDCAVRSAGLYDYPLRLRRRILSDPAVDLAPATAYDLPPARRLERYAAVPRDLVARQAPAWPLLARVAPRPATAEVLPQLLHELAAVVPAADGNRIAASDPTPEGDPSGADATAEAVDSLVRGTSGPEAPGGDRSATGELAATHRVRAGGDPYPGEGVVLPAAVDSRVDAPDGPVDVTVVCNAPDMADEVDAVDEMYGGRIEPRVRRRLDRAALADALASEADLLHFVGHADEGLRCPDGHLDVAAVDRVGPRAVLLNACDSVAQGRAAVEAGAVAAVVTLADVVNAGAVRVGRRIARLIDAGFPVRGAVATATAGAPTTGQYAVVGDGSLTLGDETNRTPCVCTVDRADDGGYELRLRTYPTDDTRLGSVYQPRIPGVEEYFLTCGTGDPIAVSAPDLEEFLSFDGIPVRVGERLRWSGDVDVTDVDRLLRESEDR